MRDFLRTTKIATVTFIQNFDKIYVSKPSINSTGRFNSISAKGDYYYHEADLETMINCDALFSQWKNSRPQERVGGAKEQNKGNECKEQ